MPRIIKIAFLLNLTTTTSVTLAGVWSSGGGELLKDAKNPWFIQNTKTVRPCLIVDQASFHTVHNSVTDLRKSVDAAIRYWQMELKKAYVVKQAIKVGTQEFQEPAIVQVLQDGKLAHRCPRDTLLTIQFGWLSKKQKDWLISKKHKPGDLVAIAVRTDYDEIHMRGQGFIFVAGDEGPWAIRGENIVAKPWALGQGKLLDEVLKHEFGHVFGVPHLGLEGPMSPSYVEIILQKDWATDIAINGRNTPFFGIKAPYTLRKHCYPTKMRNGWQRFIDAPSDHNCLLAQLKTHGINFYSSKNAGLREFRGTLFFTGKDRYSWQDAVHLYVPKQQQAFSCPDPQAGAGICPWLVGPMIKLSHRAGYFISVKGLTRQVSVMLSPQGIGFAQSIFNVEIDGNWHWNIDWDY